MMSSSALAKHPEILSPLRTKAELKLSALYLLPTSFSIFLGLGLVSSSFLCGPGLLAYPEVLRHVFFNLEAPSVLVLEMESWNIARGSRISRCQSAAATVPWLASAD
jgi:hypothetical protein